MCECENKVWKYKYIDESKVQEIKSRVLVSDFLAKVLATLNVDVEDMESFLKPRLSSMNDPFLLKDMNKCVYRIVKALDDGEHIVIFGDYDVDGITSTAIMYDFLTELGGKVDYYVPNRLSEGYGLSKSAVDNALEKKPDLIITVDCGITSVQEVDYIRSKGVEIIITDHHECGSKLPNAYGVINPMRDDNKYPFRSLAGVGVALKLIIALCKEKDFGDQYLKYMDIVLLGTVADVVSLTDENRAMVRYGLKKMNKMPNLGISKLIEASGIRSKEITTANVGFGLAPRLNAAGRLGDATQCVELLTTRDKNRAEHIANFLEHENRERKKTEQAILEEALEKIKANGLDKDKVIVVSDENWHRGVIGIVASRITDMYFKPSIVLTMKDGIANGSARSIKNFDLFCAISECKDLLVNFGGHKMAAGLTINQNNIDLLRKRINEYADEKLDLEGMRDVLDITMQLDITDITLENAKKLEHLKPFGSDNPVPIFSCYNMKVVGIRVMTEGKHLKLVLGGGNLNSTVEALGFNMGNIARTIHVDDHVDVVFELGRNNWNGRENVQMIIKDMIKYDG